MAIGVPAQQQQVRQAFERQNPLSDRFGMKAFHHIEFYCGDAINTASRFSWGLGMPMVAKSDQSTGNPVHASYVLRSHDLTFVFTAPYATHLAVAADKVQRLSAPPTSPLPGFDADKAYAFFRAHGMAARAIGIEVEDAAAAYEQCTANGGTGVLAPTDCGNGVTVSEVAAYGDVVLRFVSYGQGVDAHSGAFLPGFQDISAPKGAGGEAWPATYGIERVDHAVGNVWDMMEAVERLGGMTGMHRFAEFTAEDVGTVDSGLNSVVLASNNEVVLLPLNEPTYGTKRKSQIQTYLEQNVGPGLQHLALKTNDIIGTLRLMKERSHMGGFEFLDAPGEAYYSDLPARVPELTPQQVSELQELGVLADKDDQGILLQIFTKPCGDRPTFFIEIIQRIGCEDAVELPGGQVQMVQRGGCGGFGKGNFRALFKSIEDYEKKLGV
ncbi:p-hydroxyphenylpyruvate dioxygenase [Tribonema minus]|uniref:4-hydroxyphenylpyruvate dioxygenase n=1 Tax=Tribonema minus TaxID=303371 RepID=A0A835YZ91_9STRA|nr:p-hydroxyphenylpyruvate dioxygenase [Tribonema minus]